MLSRRGFIGGLALGGGLAAGRAAHAAGDSTGQLRLVRRGSVSFYSPPTALAWSPDLRRMAAIVNFGRAVEVVDIASGRSLFRTPRKQSLDNAGVWFSPDGKEVYSLSSTLDGPPYDPVVATAWDADTGRIIRHYMRPDGEPGKAGFDKLALSPDGNLLVVIGTGLRSDTHCLVFRARQSSLLQTILTGGTARFRFGNISARNQIVTTINRIREPGARQRMQLYDLESGVLVRTFEGHRNDINDAAFNFDGSLLASGEAERQWKYNRQTGELVLEGEDDPIRIWNVDTGAQVGGITRNRLPVKYLFWLGASGFLLSEGGKEVEDKLGSLVAIWDSAANTKAVELQTADRGSAALDAICPSHDGKLVAMSSTSRVEIYGIEPG